MLLTLENPQIQLEHQLLKLKGQLNLQPGSTHVINGPSGCGKSSLLLAICGLLPLKSGALRWQGEPVTSHNIHNFRQHIGWLPQQPWLGDSTVIAALKEACEINHQPWQPQQVAELIQQLQLKSELLQQPCGKLSGGERSRFALLRILLLKRSIILADEPTAALDSSNSQSLIRLQQSQPFKQTCWLSISHDPEWSSAQQHQYLLNNGQLTLRESN